MLQRFRLVYQLLVRASKISLILFLGYLGILLLGLFPVNYDFESPSEDGVTIYVTSSSVHADLFLPVRIEEIDWRKEFGPLDIASNIEDSSYVAIGWGDRGFYLETETWNDLQLSTASNALLIPSESCLHIDFTSPEYASSAKSIIITQAQYRELVAFIRSSIRRDVNGNAIQIKGYAYGNTDAFIEAHGYYHLLNTCNSWIGRALAQAGVRTPWLTPLPHTPTLYLK